MNAGSGEEFWARFPRDPRDPGHAGLRAGDAERLLVLDLLADAYADGRLDRPEHDRRVGLVSEATLLGDLPTYVEDLVAPEAPRSAALVPADLHARAVQRFEKERREAVWSFLSSTLICWLIWAVVMPGGFPWPAIVMLATGLNAARVQWQRDDIVASAERHLERRARKREQALERTDRRELPPPRPQQDG